MLREVAQTFTMLDYVREITAERPVPMVTCLTLMYEVSCPFGEKKRSEGFTNLHFVGSIGHFVIIFSYVAAFTKQHNEA